MFERSSGILLHPSSLPGNYGIGDLGNEAYKFIDFLINSGQKLWQIFPLGPTGYGDSPYQCFSAFAGNLLLISLEELKKMGLLSNDDLNLNEEFDSSNVDYGKVLNVKTPLLKKAFNNYKLKNDLLLNNKFERFCNENKNWLEDYALYRAIKTHFDEKCWVDWDDREIRFRENQAIEKYSEMLSDDIAFRKFVQFIFFMQWGKIKNYANENGIKIVGDIPIFVSLDSSDAWANSELFLFDEERRPYKVAGVPPDYFSETGQLWGNPLYDWDKMQANGFKWWIDRIKANLKVADIIRVDHFRGFAAYWGVPADETTAINGEWFKSPGKELFKAIENELGKLPIIAEDLGIITPDVVELRDHFDFPGMKILQFAFDGTGDSDHALHKCVTNSVVYTGTHDNDTANGWFSSISDEEKTQVRDYLKINTKSDNVSWDFIQATFNSNSKLAIIPLQDILGTTSEGRMNIPGKSDGNWQWRYQKENINNRIAKKLKSLTTLYSR